jgi:hypothetical protein
LHFLPPRIPCCRFVAGFWKLNDGDCFNSRHSPSSQRPIGLNGCDRPKPKIDLTDDLLGWCKSKRRTENAELVFRKVCVRLYLGTISPAFFSWIGVATGAGSSRLEAPGLSMQF